MDVNDLCQKVMGEFAGLNTKMESVTEEIKEIKGDIREIRDGRHQNGLGAVKLESRLDVIEKSYEKHDKEHRKTLDNRDKRNWQMWFLIISIIIGGLAGWGFYLLRG